MMMKLQYEKHETKDLKIKLGAAMLQTRSMLNETKQTLSITEKERAKLAELDQHHSRFIQLEALLHLLENDYLKVLELTLKEYNLIETYTQEYRNQWLF